MINKKLKKRLIYAEDTAKKAYNSTKYNNTFLSLHLLEFKFTRLIYCPKFKTYYILRSVQKHGDAIEVEVIGEDNKPTGIKQEIETGYFLENYIPVNTKNN